MNPKPITESIPREAEKRVVTLIHGAIAGASIAAILQLASRESLSPLLLVALGCFAIAIPAAIALVVISQVIYELGKQSTGAGAVDPLWPAPSSILAVGDQLASYLGFLAIFWHFHWVIGLIFLSTTALAFVTTWLAEKSLRSKEDNTVVDTQAS